MAAFRVRVARIKEAEPLLLQQIDVAVETSQAVRHRGAEMRLQNPEFPRTLYTLDISKLRINKCGIRDMKEEANSSEVAP